MELGEVLLKILEAGRAFVGKYFAGNPEPLASLADLPDELIEATLTFDEKLRSSARGGEKVTLGLMKAHYTDAEAWCVASGFPLEKEDGTPLEEKDRKAILHFVSSYASKIGRMVSLTTFFKEVPCPPAPVQSDDEGEEANQSA